MKTLKYVGLTLAAILTLGISVKKYHPKDSPFFKSDISLLAEPNENINFSELRSGNTITIYLPDNLEVLGTINCVQVYTDGIVRFGGSFEDGTFAFAVNNEQTISGLVFHKGEVYELPESSTKGLLIYNKKDINSVLCHQHPSDVELASGTLSTGTVSSGSISTGSVNSVPILSSKPNSINQLYLEFRGATVQDPLWNGGKTIIAASPNYTVSQITDIYNVVAARYAAFDINVTTNFDLYSKSKPSTRTRAIFTTTDSWYPNCGGVAYIGSFRAAGVGIYTPNIPCWVFTKSFGNVVKSVGEVAAHEVGHTLGLSHDGTPSSAYYYGQGNWAPIMGCAYGKTIVQFSKGEYVGANNKQDDISVLRSNLSMGSLHVSPASPLDLKTGTLATIFTSADTKTYTLPVQNSGSLTVTVMPALYSAVDVTIQLLKNGSLVTSSSPINCQSASICVPVSSGTYSVLIIPSGNNDPNTAAYSSYGSIGNFILSSSLVSTGSIK